MTQEQVLAKLGDGVYTEEVEDGKVYVEGDYCDGFVEGYIGADGNVSELMINGCPVEGLAVSI